MGQGSSVVGPEAGRRSGQLDRTPISVHLKRASVFLALLAALTITLYSGTLSFGFVWDDHPQIVNNPLIRSWHSIGRVFTNDLWFHTGRAQLYYRPMFIVWSIFNYSLFGLRTWGWHLGAILLHVAAAISVYLFARRMRLEHWTAALAATTFAVHPVHIECVAWISAASDTLVTVFYVLAFLSFLNSRDSDGTRARRWKFLSFVLLAGGLLTKEMAVTFPVLIGLYCLLFPLSAAAKSLVQRIRDSAVAASQYAILVLAYAVLRKIALHRAVGSFDPENTPIQVLLTLPQVLFGYLRNQLVPVGLTGLYYNPYISTAGFRSFYLPFAVLIGFCCVIWYWAKRTNDKSIVFFALWTLLTLAPVLYLPTFHNGDFVRDRYVYLPSVGLIILCAKALRQLPGIGSVSRRSVQVACTVVLCAGMVLGCVTQQVYWSSDLLLFARGHDLYPDNMYATLGLANALGSRGSYKRALDLLEESVTRLNPRDSYESYKALTMLAEAYARLGRVEEGRQALQTAQTRFPNIPMAELGKAEFAGLLGRLHEYDRALAVCAEVLQQEPDLYAAIYNCGNVNLVAGRYPQAEQLLSRAAREMPNRAAPTYFLGRTLFATGRYSEAEMRFRRAVELEPDGYEYHLWMGQSLQQRGALSEARQEYLRALNLNPDDNESKERLSTLEKQLMQTN